MLSSAVRGEDRAPVRLGSLIAARFADAGLEGEIEELRGQPVRPARFEQ